MASNPGKIRRHLDRAKADIQHLMNHMEEVDNDVIIEHFQRIYSLFDKIVERLDKRGEL